MNFENSKSSDPHRLLLNLSDKLDLSIIDEYVALTNLSIYYAWKNIKKSYKINKLKNISSRMEWKIWITWRIIFCITCSRLF